APAWEAADPVDLAQRPEAPETSGQVLVGICLMAGVPDDLVARRGEERVECDRDLDHAKAGSEVAARLRDRRDDRVADLDGELLELVVAEPAQVRGALQGCPNRGGHGRGC